MEGKVLSREALCYLVGEADFGHHTQPHKIADSILATDAALRERVRELGEALKHAAWSRLEPRCEECQGAANLLETISRETGDV